MKFLVASLVFVNILFAQTLSVGDNYPSYKLVDQFEKTGKIDSDDEIIIMTFEKGISSDLNELLQDKKSDYLKTKKTKYVAEISGMPSVITKMFALPKMKKYKYRIYLIKDESQGEVFPRKDDLVSVFKVKDSKIESIEFKTPKEVIEFLDK